MDPIYSSNAVAESLRASQRKLSERFGDFFSPASFCRAVAGGMDLQTLEAWEAQYRYLSVMTSDGFRVYPALQLDVDGEPIDGLGEILEILLPPAADGWTVLYWLTAPLADWGNRTVAEILEGGQPSEVESMILLARSDADVWAAVG